VLDQEMLDEEGSLVVLGLLVDPDLVLWDVSVALVLAEVGELPVDVPADVAAVGDPDLQIAALLVRLQIGRLQIG
jgi:hypothetical protein